MSAPDAGPIVRVATAADAEAITRIYAPIVANTVISFELDVPTVDEMRGPHRHHARAFPVAGQRGRARCGRRLRVCEPASRTRRLPVVGRRDRVRARGRARARGVGKRLYGRLFEELTELGYFQAFAGIALPNDASVALHESVGFVPLGIYRGVGFKRGAWHDVGWWQRTLQPPSTPHEPLPFGGA